MMDRPRMRFGADAASETSTLLDSLARVRRRCRVLNGAYEAAEDKPEVLVRIQEELSRLRGLHARLPSPLRQRSWVLTLEYYNTWVLEARRSA